MTELHYAFQELITLRKVSEKLNLYALVDGIQFERAFDEPFKENKGVRSLFSLPEDKALAFAGPWLLDISELAREDFLKLCQLEKKYPAISWIISEQPFMTLVRHLEPCLMVSLPSKEKGLFRFYDCRVLKRLPELLSSGQIAELMKYSQRWFFLSEGEFNCYQCDAGVLRHCVLGSNDLNREI